jgi:hypothetical protein
MARTSQTSHKGLKIMTTTTFDFDAAIAAAVANHNEAMRRRREQEAAEQARRDAEKAAIEQEEIDILQQQIDEEISAEVQQAVQLRTVYVAYGAEAHLTIDGERWQIDRATNSWWIRPPRTQNINVKTSGELQHALLVTIARERQQRQKELEREQEEQRKLAEADATSAAIEAQIAAAQEQARRELWQWPEGRDITIYRWRWCTAAGAGEYGAEYSSGWSRQWRLDGEGLLRLEQETYADPRVVVLDMQAHKPVVELYTFGSVADLPRELVERVDVRLEVGWSDHWADRKTRYMITPGYHTSFDVGIQPVAWVRQVVDERGGD